MKRIVVGYDCSEQAEDALALGANLRDALGAELTVAVVDQVEPLFGDVEALTETRQEFFAGAFDRAAEALGDSNFARRTGDGSAPGELERIVSETDADLIVAGSTHRGPVGRVLPGSVGERLLAGSPAAVMIAPRGYRERKHPPIDLIGVGYDGSEESRHALRFAAVLARELGASLRPITASPTAEITGLLDAALRELPAELSVEPALREGEPSAVLADQSVELDLLVLGSRRYGPLRRVLVGSVSAKVAGLAACPVVVAPRAGP